MPLMKTQSIGYGMGKKDFAAANCVRAMLGTSDDQTDMVVELSCNVDDMSAEEIGYACERFFAGGAREVFTTPAGMKKSRPGTWIHVICTPGDKEGMLKLLFEHTTTIGVREQIMNRYVMDRRIETAFTPYGEVRKKISEGYGVRREKYEYEDLARIAENEGVSLDEIKRKLDRI